MPEGTTAKIANTPQRAQVASGPIPGSQKIHVAAWRDPQIRVAMREIALSGGEAPLTVYDCSGPYTDPAATIDIAKGLAPIRAAWIDSRGDTETYDGRAVRPEDDGRGAGESAALPAFPSAGRKVRRASSGRAVTQMAYARAGIVTPEMEYVAARENEGRRADRNGPRDGQSFGAMLPDFVTPEFVRDEIARGRAILPNNISIIPNRSR